MTEGVDNRWVELPETVAVYVLCTTVAVEDDRISFFGDIYGYDSALAPALDTRYVGRAADGGAWTGDTAAGGGGGVPMYRPVRGARPIAGSRPPAALTIAVPGGSPAVAPSGGSEGRLEGP